MADYWSQAAFSLNLIKPEARDAFLRIASLLREYEPDEPLSDELSAVFGPTPTLDLGPMSDTVEVGHGSIYVFVSAAAQLEPELLARVLQHVMRAHDLPGPLGFEWAITCSRQRIDGFGGGAVLVWPDRTRWLSTSQWLDELGEAPEEDAPVTPEAEPPRDDAVRPAAQADDASALDDLSVEVRERFDHDRSALFEALARAGIAQVIIAFDGYGDEGHIEDVTAFAPDGSIMPMRGLALPPLSIFSAGSLLEGDPRRGEAPKPSEVLRELAYDLLGHACGG